MPSLFVSHSSQDDEVATAFVTWLRGQGVQSLFLDFSPDAGIPAGRDWERELYAQVQRADAVAFLSSPASVRSPWCFTEVALARVLDKPVIPVVVAPGARLGLLQGVQHVDFRPDDGSAGERLRRALRAVGLDPRASVDWDPSRPVYPGLTSFEEADAGVFFGRDAEAGELVRLVQAGPGGRGQLVAVVGPSGSGKSSLVRAGLVPRLRQRPWLVLPVVVPGTEPTRALARSLAAALEHTAPVPAVAARLRTQPQALRDLVEDVRDLVRGSPSVLVVVDQAEELLTRTPADERARFLDLLRHAVSDGRGTSVVVTLRAEFLAPLLQQPEVGRLVDATQLVSSLDRARLAVVVEGPAARAGFRFEPGLVGRIVEDAAGGDALPLLAFTLHQLGEQVGRDGRITTAAYDAAGGVLGALRREADRVAARFPVAECGDLVLSTLVQLAAVSLDGEPTRRRVARATSTREEDEVLSAFIEARLLVAGADEHGRAVVEVAHEALLRQWPPLRAAIDARREDLHLREELRRWASEWARAGRDDSYLVRGERLRAADRWAQAHAQELSRLGGEVRDFLDASRALQVRADVERRDAEEQRRLAQARGLFQRLRADVERSQALLELEPVKALAAAVAVTGTALDTLGGEPLAVVQSCLFTAVRTVKERRVLIGHEAAVTGVAVDPRGRYVVSASLDRTVRLWPTAGRAPSTVLSGHRAAATCVAVSSDGSLIASGGADGAVRLHRAEGAAVGERRVGDGVLTVAVAAGDVVVAGGGDGGVCAWAADGRLLWRLDLPSFVASLDVSPGGLLVAGCGNGTVHTTTLTSTRSVTSWQAHDDAVTSVRLLPPVADAPSPEDLVVSAGADGAVRSWRLDGQLHTAFSPLRGPQRALLTSLDVAPGDVVVGAAEDGAVRLWDLTGAPVSAPLRCPGTVVSSVAVGPSGTRLAGGVGAQVRLWDWLPAEVPTPVRPSRRAAGPSRWDPLGDQAGPACVSGDFVAAVAFTPDGTGVVSAGGDRTLRVWDLDGSVRHCVPDAHDGGITAVATGPRGMPLIATGGRDEVVRLFDLEGRAVGSPLHGHGADVMAVCFDGRGGSVVSGSRDGTVRRWGLASREQEAVLRHSPAEVLAVACAPGTGLLASGSSDGTVRLWQPDGSPHGPVLTAHVGPVWDVAFDSSGELLLSCGQDGRVRSWRVDGRPGGEPLRGHVGAVRAGGFLPGTPSAVTAGEDGTVRLWSLEGGPLTRPMSGHEGAVFALAARGDGELLATGGQDGTVRVWRLGTWRSWLAEACDRLADHPLVEAADDPVARSARDLCRRAAGAATD